MASPTLNNILAKIGPLLEGAPGYLSGTAGSGSATTLVDAVKLKDTYVSTSRYEGAWVRRPIITTTDVERRIVTDAPSTGTLTVTPAWSVAVATDTYEVWSSYRPSEVITAVNNALNHMRILETVDITGVDDQKQYSLAAYTWFIHQDQYVGTYLRQGTTALRYKWPLIPWTDIIEDEDALTLQLNGPTYGTSDTLRFSAWRTIGSLGTLTLGTDTVAVANDPEMLEWIAWESIRELLQSGVMRRIGTESAAQATEEARVIGECRKFRNRFKIRRPVQSMFRQPTYSFGPRGYGTELGTLWR